MINLPELSYSKQTNNNISTWQDYKGSTAGAGLLRKVGELLYNWTDLTLLFLDFMVQ